MSKTLGTEHKSNCDLFSDDSFDASRGCSCGAHIRETPIEKLPTSETEWRSFLSERGRYVATMGGKAPLDFVTEKVNEIIDRINAMNAV